MNLRARALDHLEALLDEPHEVQDARIAELALHDDTLADEVRRLIAADREEAPETELTERVRRAAQDFDLPDKLGPYVIIREIGRGGMGVVYEAEQLRPIRRVALKTLPVLGVTPDARRRFDMEVQALARVLHPGIPQVYEVFEHDGRPILAMELVQGRRLDQALEPMPTRARAKVLQQVAEAVAAAHAQGIVHRDLKPANILVGADGQPKVLDFSIAALEGSEQLAEGTPRYMAPEQRAGLPQDSRVDVYALGVLAGELLGEDRQRRDDLDRLLAHATAEDPAARLPSARALAEELHRWRTWRPLRTVSTSAPRRLALLARQAPLAMTLAMLVVLLAAGMFGVVGWQGLTWWDARRLAALKRQAAEQAAARRLEALQQWAETAGPDAPALRDTFRRLVGDPTLDGAAALSDAWTWWATQETDTRRVPEALAQAWVHATHEDRERRTRTALAREAWQRGR